MLICKMEATNYHKNIIRIQLIFAVWISFNICYAKTVTDSSNNCEASTYCTEINGKLSDLTETVEKLLQESKLKDIQLKEMKIQWLHESKVLKHKVAELERRNYLISGIPNQGNEYPSHSLNNSVSSQNGRVLMTTHRIHKSKYMYT